MWALYAARVDYKPTMCTAFLVIRRTKQLLLWKKKLQKRSPSKFITVSALSGHPKNVRKHFTAEKPPYLLHNEPAGQHHHLPGLTSACTPALPRSPDHGGKSLTQTRNMIWKCPGSEDSSTYKTQKLLLQLARRTIRLDMPVQVELAYIA